MKVFVTGVGGTLGRYLFLRLGIPLELRVEILQRAPQPLRRVLERFVAAERENTA